jgi:predicted transglutaminase-like cysteine proteinase
MWVRSIAAVAVTLFITLLPQALFADDARGTSIAVLGPARPPQGYIQFCRDYRGECASKASLRPELLTEASFELLDRVNRDVNARIKPVSDLELYGKAEVWAIPVNAGDCEDYVLLKRKLLIEAGLPASALLITVVRDQHGDGHAVLTAVTVRGDLILDNQDDRILPWTITPYRYVKRQSVLDQNAWVLLGDPGSTVRVATTPRQ